MSNSGKGDSPMSEFATPTYDPRLVRVSEALKTVETPGDCFTSGSFSQFPLPGMVISEFGEVPLPLRENEAKKVIAKCSPTSSIAHSGVRNTWELNAAGIEFINPEWSRQINSIVEAIGLPLGIGESIKFEAQLCKLLLCEKGGMLQVSQNNEKKTGIFGTLVVTLPCHFEGGDVHVHHPLCSNAESHEWSPRALNEEDLKYAAFYGDCELNVKAVTSGFQLSLIYNLVALSTSVVPRFGGNHDLYAKFEAALEDFFSKQDDDKDILDDERCDKSEECGEENANYAAQECTTIEERVGRRDAMLVYMLEAKYTERSLSFDYLKSRDQMVAQCLAKYAQENQRAYNLYLTKVKYNGDIDIARNDSDIEETFNDEEPSDDELANDAEHDAEDEPDRSKSVLFHPSIKFGEKGVLRHRYDSANLEKEVAPAGFFDKIEFDDTIETGNSEDDSLRMERWYKSAALVLMPMTREFKEVASRDIDCAIDKWIKCYENGSPHVNMFASAIFGCTRDWTTKTGSFMKAMSVICQLDSVEIFYKALMSLQFIEFQSDLAGTVQQLGWEKCFTPLVHVASVLNYPSRVNLVCSVLDGITDVSIISSLLQHVNLQPQSKSKCGVLPPSYRDYTRELPRDSVSSEDFCHLLKIALVMSPEMLREVTETPEVKALVTIVAPGVACLVNELSSYGQVPVSVVEFVHDVIDDMEARAPLEENWSLPEAKVDGTCCSMCSKLKDFTASRTEKTLCLSPPSLNHIYDVISSACRGKLSSRSQGRNFDKLLLTKRWPDSDLYLKAQEAHSRLKSALRQLA